MKSRLSVLIADDHTLVGELLRQRLDLEPDIDVVASVTNAREAVEGARRHKPDVVVLDIEMPGLSVFDAVRRIRADHPETKVVLLTAHCTDQYIRQALQLEISGYATKNEPLDVVVKAIRSVAAGGVYFSEDVRSRIVVHRRGASLAGQLRSRIDLLTTREVEVLGYVARGMAKKEIAVLMDISVKTVEQHCTHLMMKLDIHDRVQLARFAIREGVAGV